MEPKESLFEQENADSQPKQYTTSSASTVTRTRVMIVIDGSESTRRAVDAALSQINKQLDFVYLVHVHSSWDYLNDEKNTGNLYLGQFADLLTTLKVSNRIIQRDSNYPYTELKAVAEEKKVHTIYVGESACTECASDDNLLFNMFSTARRWVVGTAANYLLTNCSEKFKVVVVPDPVDQPED
mmetsp:Transcript_9319/g.10304  ORF Transcript_9319/g.10304 Transcript_9319/m.10304 type:complete len:183 (+) Transcript_9319:65-613(+)